MSIFYCQVHHQLEDSDFVGYYVVKDKEVCDEGKAELEVEEEKE